MSYKVDLVLIDKAKFLMKLQKLHKKMKECMDAEGVISCMESTGMVLHLLPEYMREDLVDRLIQTIDETTERLNRCEGEET